MNCLVINNMWWFFFILFLLISIFSSIALFYSLKRINQYENYLYQFQQIIEISHQKLKSLDNKGSFESDDEVGFMFQQMKDIQTLLNDLLIIESDEEGKDGDSNG
tara:strand:- start:295 stop:609 length:315 start_codon:yes stop_codon:yes gene_type:complete